MKCPICGAETERLYESTRMTKLILGISVGFRHADSCIQCVYDFVQGSTDKRHCFHIELKKPLPKWLSQFLKKESDPGHDKKRTGW